MNVVVLGATGLAGTHVAGYLTATGEHTVRAFGSKECDVRDADSVNNAVCDPAHEVDVIVNCAAYANADKAESEHTKAFLVNEDGAANVARAARRRGVRLVHLSTNFAYPGPGDPSMRDEVVEDAPDDPPSHPATFEPQGVYARSKYGGDARVLHEHRRNVVLRTTSLYGVSGSGGNYVSSLVTRVAKGQPLTLDPTRMVQPTSGFALAKAVAAILASDQQEVSGVVHFACGGQTTWAAFGRALCVALGRSEHPVVDFEPPYKAPRPRVLLGCRVLEALGYEVPTWQEALAEVVDFELQHGQHAEAFAVEEGWDG